MKISTLIKDLKEMQKNWGDLDVKIDAGMSATLGKHQYVVPGTAIRNFTDKDGNRKQTLVLW